MSLSINYTNFKLVVYKELNYMKKIVTFLMCCLMFCFCGCSSVKIDDKSIKTDNKSKGMAKFEYGDKDILTEISDSELKEIINIFESKDLYTDEPSCSFSENISVIIDDSHFCIANDECGIVYLKEENKYFNLTDNENKRLREILVGYGFSFPCL